MGSTYIKIIGNKANLPAARVVFSASYSLTISWASLAIVIPLPSMTGAFPRYEPPCTVSSLIKVAFSKEEITIFNLVNTQSQTIYNF